MDNSPLAPAAERAPSRLSGLDGLRAIAVLAVVAYHLAPETVTGGFIGVDVFFVISGFLITTLILRDRAAGRFSLKDFWLRRARRLLPALVLVVVITVAGAALIGGDVLVGLKRQIVGAATFSSNWIAIAAGDSYTDTLAPQLLRNLWSLAVEEQWYLLWPMVLLLLSRIRSAVLAPILVIAGIGSAVWMVALAGESTNRAYLGTDSHMFGLIWGAALACAIVGWTAREQPRWARQGLAVSAVVALAAVVWLCVTLTDTGGAAYTWGIAAASALTAVVLMGASNGSWLGRALDVAPMRWIGDRSYGIYLWHWPVLVLVQAAWPATPPIVIILAVLALTAAAVQLSYTLVEQPIRRQGLRGTLRTWMGISARNRRAAVAMTATVAAGILIVAQGAIGVASAPIQSSAGARIDEGIRLLESQEPQQSTAPAGRAPRHAGERPKLTPEPTKLTPEPNASPSADPTAPPVEAPTVNPPNGENITAIGDSVMLASVAELNEQFPGIEVDAETSRSFAAGVAIAEQLKAEDLLREWVVLGLGTNGPVQESSLDAVRELADEGHHVVLVDAVADRSWIKGVNQALNAVAKEDGVDVATWTEGIEGKMDLLAGDRIHPGPAAAEIYAGVIGESLQRLAAEVS